MTQTKSKFSPKIGRDLLFHLLRSALLINRLFLDLFVHKSDGVIHNPCYELKRFGTKENDLAMDDSRNCLSRTKKVPFKKDLKVGTVIA